MITLQDLDTAIAKCQGETNPNVNTCIKLAAFYTIRQEMFGGPVKTAVDPGEYSTQAAPTNLSALAGRRTVNTISYDGGSEFARLINGLDLLDVLDVMDELLNVLQATNPRLYDGVIRKIQQI